MQDLLATCQHHPLADSKETRLFSFSSFFVLFRNRHDAELQTYLRVDLGSLMSSGNHAGDESNCLTASEPPACTDLYMPLTAHPESCYRRLGQLGSNGSLRNVCESCMQRDSHVSWMPAASARVIPSDMAIRTPHRLQAYAYAYFVPELAQDVSAIWSCRRRGPKLPWCRPGVCLQIDL